MTLETLEILFDFLIAARWPLTILVIIIIISRSFKKLKKDVTKATVEKIMDDRNKEGKNES